MTTERLTQIIEGKPDNVRELFQALGDSGSLAHLHPDALVSVELHLVSYDPVAWQCTAKPWSAHLSWGTAVHKDPMEAWCRAVALALQGEEARLLNSEAVFHLDRGRAIAILDLLKLEHEEIVDGRVEFEPYRGWVVVAYAMPGVDIGFLKPKVEVRVMPTHAPRGEAVRPAGRSTRSEGVEEKPKRTRSSGSVKATGAPEIKEGRMSMSKSALEDEYKGIYGKQPDRNIKKADLATFLDRLAAGETLEGPTFETVTAFLSTAPSAGPSAPEESDEDLM